MIEIVPCTPRHIIDLRKNLREKEKLEIKNFGLCARQALWNSFNESLNPKAVIADGKIAGVFGCCGTVIGQVGQPWMLATPVADNYPLQFALLYRQEVQKMLELYDVLENVVDASYKEAVKLLELIGFTVYDATPMGRNGALFRTFRMTA